MQELHVEKVNSTDIAYMSDTHMLRTFERQKARFKKKSKHRHT